ncbi:MAG: hypothetical protein II902_09925 [Selenomonadaceae bacterium]|nr:hypothetical protein [Selenomonadaceae bacterium]
MDDGRAASAAVMAASGALTAAGYSRVQNTDEQRPREAHFLFVTFSLGEQRESKIKKIKNFLTPNEHDAPKH